MKPFLFPCALLALCCYIWSSPVSNFATPLASYAAVDKKERTSCALDPQFVPVHHTARRHLVFLLGKLTPVSGMPFVAFNVEMMRDRRGVRAIKTR